MKLYKSLGQHFLIDDNTSLKIFGVIKSLNLGRVVEIGPGAGALTKYFVTNNLLDNFLCCEIDLEKVDFLEKTYQQLIGKIIKKDFLSIDIPFKDNFAVVGNFPYNISSQILFKILDWRDKVDFVVGMFQKEVAQRIVSNHGNKIYGILSVLIQSFYDCEILFDVDASCFKPVPNVTSSILLLRKKYDTLNIDNFELFKKIVKSSFQQRRKKLRNALSSIFSKETLSDKLFDLRAENLTFNQFFYLYGMYKKLYCNFYNTHL